MCRPYPLKPFDFKLVQISNVKSNQAPATLESIQYRCQIVNNILKTTLTQTFSSKSENEYSETLYYFPVEENICLESFVAKFNEKTIKGIVKDKDAAKKEYESNKSQGNFVSYASVQKTKLEEYVKIKLGNLPPSSKVEIVLTFSQQLNSIFNKYYMAYIPLQYVDDEISVKQGKDVLVLDLFCTGKIKYANSKGYPAEKTMVDDNTARFTLSQALLQQNLDFQLIFSYEGMFDPQVILGSSKVYHEDSVKQAILPVGNSAMVSFIPNFNEEISEELDDTIRAAINNGEDILSDAFQQKLNQELIDHLNSSRSEFLFLLDRSGSMSGKPIQKACEALTLFLKSLPNDSYFNVVSFGSGHQNLFPQSQKYTTESLNKAIGILSLYSADLGGTEIFNPLQSIFKGSVIKGYNKQIFLLTDGEVDQPENVVSLIKKNNRFNRVHSIGFGSGADRFLIEQSAVAGKGISKIVDLSCDLSEVIVDMLATCITPTFNEFTINYDHSVFDTTYPLASNFPCVFKDEIINIHFFFKPQVELSSLTDGQKQIQINYYDSHQKKMINKNIKLEMADCFTCNPELQESVFKLGKQLYLNENILTSNNSSELVQQAIDYQLLTEKTALICVIQTLNDEQKIMYENVNHNVVYQQEQIPVQNYQYQSKQSPLSSISAATTTSVTSSYSPKLASMNGFFNKLSMPLPPPPPSSLPHQIQQNIQSQSFSVQNQNYPNYPPTSETANYNMPCPPPGSSMGFFGGIPSQPPSFPSNFISSPPCLSGPPIPQSANSNTQNYPSQQFMQNCMDSYAEQVELNSLSRNKSFENNNNNNNNNLVASLKSESDSASSDEECEEDNDDFSSEKDENVCYKMEAECEEIYYARENNSGEDENQLNDNFDFINNLIQNEAIQLESKEAILSKPSSIQKQSDCSPKDSCKKRKSSLSKQSKTPTLKLDNILKLVDSQGVWQFDLNLINQLANIEEDTVKQLSSQFTTNDAFMTLFILIILELFYSGEKTKWVLISKKSTSFIKKGIKQGSDYNTLKQQLSENITN